MLQSTSGVTATCLSTPRAPKRPETGMTIKLCIRKILQLIQKLRSLYEQENLVTDKSIWGLAAETLNNQYEKLHWAKSTWFCKLSDQYTNNKQLALGYCSRILLQALPITTRCTNPGQGLYQLWRILWIQHFKSIGNPEKTHMNIYDINNMWSIIQEIRTSQLSV